MSVEEVMQTVEMVLTLLVILLVFGIVGGIECGNIPFPW